MSVAARDASAPSTPQAEALDRPTWLSSVLLDGTLAVLSFVTVSVLAPDSHQGSASGVRAGAWPTLLVVVGVQIASLALGRAYGRWHRVDWLIRIFVSVVVGTALAAVILKSTDRFERLPDLALIGNAFLLTVMAIAWRGAWALRRRARASARAGTDELIDRTADLTTFGGVVANLYTYRELLRNLVLKDLKLKYRGSVFGFLWSLANPLLMTVVYTFAFTVILGFRSETFVFSLLLGQLAWTFFASSAVMSTGAIIDNGGLLKSVLFPRAILPVGIVLFNLAQYLLTIAVFLPLMMAWHHTPIAASMLCFPIFLGMQIVFTIGVALTLATATAFFRDVRHLLEVALSVLFWSTPIVYELTQVPERLRLPILLSPMSSFVVGYQQIFVHQRWPEPALWLIAAAQAVGAFSVGTLLLLNFEDRFTEHL